MAPKVHACMDEIRRFMAWHIELLYTSSLIRNYLDIVAMLIGADVPPVPALTSSTPPDEIPASGGTAIAPLLSVNLDGGILALNKFNLAREL